MSLGAGVMCSALTSALSAEAGWKRLGAELEKLGSTDPRARGLDGGQLWSGSHSN